MRCQNLGGNHFPNLLGDKYKWYHHSEETCPMDMPNFVSTMTPAWEAKILRNDVAHGGQHCHATLLNRVVLSC